MPETMRPRLRMLSDEAVRAICDDALRVLDEVGVFVEHDEARERLLDAGARLDGERVHLDPGMVARARESVPARFHLHDRAGENPVCIGDDEVAFDPGSAAIKVLDPVSGAMRPSLSSDCVDFARLTDALEAFAIQSTAVVPTDIPTRRADRHRLRLALEHGRKPVVTGTFDEESWERMRGMLVAVRGSAEALREKPLAVFDCCPTAPLSWSTLTCESLVRCAEHGIPAETISMPMTGATAPVTLRGSVVQHAAESLSGLVIHQLFGPGAPFSWGACTSAFDMRRGTSPYGAVETWMLNACVAQVGKHLGLPTHAYLGLSDSKALDFQAGMESAPATFMAALVGINIVSGAGMLEFAACQSLEKVVLDHESCRMALRAVRGVELEDDTPLLDVIRQGVAEEQFLNLRHTRKNFRRELQQPGAVIDRQVEDSWRAAGASSAPERARHEVERILGAEPTSPLPEDLCEVLRELDEG